MQLVIRLLISVAIIILCTQIGRKFPAVSGLVGTMPVLSVIILVWLYSDNPGNFKLMEDYTKAALWGIGPSILFFLAAYVCFLNQYSLGMALTAGFSAWLIGAFVHQWLL